MLFSQAASRTPLPVLPATWKSTSTLLVLMNVSAKTLPPAGSLKAAVEKSWVT
jgi:hypothetical protein